MMNWLLYGIFFGLEILAIIGSIICKKPEGKKLFMIISFGFMMLAMATVVITW